MTTRSRLGPLVRRSAAVALLFAASSFGAQACTIVSGIAADGQVWTGNNEDGPAGAALYLNVFPRTSSARFGYFTFSYGSPRNGSNGNIQGGMNEAGLTYDFNSLPRAYPVANRATKKKFPAGDNAILSHLLAQFATTEEVVRFFDEHWFARGFDAAQMHVADRHGTFAVIGPSGTRLAKQGEGLVSTNFNLGADEDPASCWRFPLATRLLQERAAGLDAFTAICRQTAQADDDSPTLSSNVQNLTTGEVWFYSARNFSAPVKTSLPDLLRGGRKSYLLRDLGTALAAR